MKIVVLDTNIWISELALMSPVGCALNYYAVKNDVKIGLPEVIEIETKYNFKTKLHEFRSNIINDHKRMLAIFRKMKEVVMPSDEEIEQKVEKIFDFHKDRIIRIPFGLNSARSSFEKIIRKEPPNSENKQQFKDGVIWANCLELAKMGDVFLITHDRAFFEDRKYEKGLAKNLLNEANQAPNRLYLFNEASQLLEKIRSKIDIDENKLVPLIEDKTYKYILRITESDNFDVGTITKKDFKFYATVKPKEIFIKFLLKYGLENKLSEDRTEAYAESKGEMLLNIDNYVIEDFRNLGEKIGWVDENGEIKEGESFHYIGNIVLGHKTIEHQIFSKLE